MHGSERKHLALMSEQELLDWVDLRHEYRSLSVTNNEMPPVGYFPGYYKNPMWVTFKRQKELQF